MCVCVCVCVCVCRLIHACVYSKDLFGVLAGPY